MSITETLRFILGHPLNAGSRADALGRYIGWQIRSRVFPGPVILPFVNSSRLGIRRGRAASTGVFYTRLHEFPEMGFVLHALREGTLFVEEGGPTVAIEAHAVGTPVIGTTIGGLAALVGDGINGAWVLPGNVNALATLLKKVISDPAETIDRWRDALPPARRTDDVTRDYVLLYNSLFNQ